MITWKAFADFFEGIWDEIRSFFGPLSKEIARSGGKFLLAVALDAVRKAEENGGTGKDKFDFAAGYAKQRLEDEGIDVLTNALYGAIIGAVAQLHEEQGNG